MDLSDEHVLELIRRVEKERIRPLKRKKKFFVTLGTAIGSFVGSEFWPLGSIAGGLIGGWVVSLITGFESFMERIENDLSDPDRNGLIQVVREAIFDLGDTLEEIWECLLEENGIMKHIIRVITDFFKNSSLV